MPPCGSPDILTGHDPLWMSAAALAVMAGHAFPVFLGFQGGKAVASFVGAFFRLTPLPMLAVLVVFVVAVAWTRQISLGFDPGGGHISAGGLADSAAAASLVVAAARRRHLHHLPASREYPPLAAKAPNTR